MSGNEGKEKPRSEEDAQKSDDSDLLEIDFPESRQGTGRRRFSVSNQRLPKVRRPRVRTEETDGASREKEKKPKGWWRRGSDVGRGQAEESHDDKENDTEDDDQGDVGAHKNGDSNSKAKDTNLQDVASQLPPHIPPTVENCIVHQLISPSSLDPSPSTATTIATAATMSRPTHQLTKTQLSAMVWNVRELSRRLGSIRVKARVRNIIVVAKPGDSGVSEAVAELAEWLVGEGCTVFVEKGILGDRERKEGVKEWSLGLCRKDPGSFDVCVTLGGDGTLLYAGWLFQGVVPPVIAFAMGSLGFLTAFDFAGYRETLTSALTTGVLINLRLRFECTVMRAIDTSIPRHQRSLVDEVTGSQRHEKTHEPLTTKTILNELVLDRGPTSSMTALTLMGDSHPYTTILSDGLCISTPTGSTAYNLAAGGSLCHPDNPVMLVTAICAHALSFRPIILPDTVVLRVGVPFDGRTSAWASFDGRERTELKGGDYVSVSAGRYPFPLVGNGEGSGEWVGRIREKLGWNVREEQKPWGN